MIKGNKRRIEQVTRNITFRHRHQCSIVLVLRVVKAIHKVLLSECVCFGWLGIKLKLCFFSLSHDVPQLVLVYFFLLFLNRN